MFARKHVNSPTERNRVNGARWVRRWHRRLGVTSALAVVLLSSTGILLNNIDRLYQSNDYVSSSWLLDWYQVDFPDTVTGNLKGEAAQHSENQYIWADGTIHVNGDSRLFDQAPLLGIYVYQEVDHLFTQKAVHLFSTAGDTIESISLQEYGPLDQVSATGEARFVSLNNGEGIWQFDLNKLVISETTGNEPPALASLAGTLIIHDNDNDHAAAQLARRQSLLKSKVLLDLHSGRIFGRFGSFAMDLFAICFLLLAITGVAAWVRQMRREKSAK